MRMLLLHRVYIGTVSKSYTEPRASVASDDDPGIYGTTEVYIYIYIYIYQTREALDFTVSGGARSDSPQLH